VKVALDQYGTLELDHQTLTAVFGGDLAVGYGDSRQSGASWTVYETGVVDQRTNYDCNPRDFPVNSINLRCRPNEYGLNPVCVNNIGCF